MVASASAGDSSNANNLVFTDGIIGFQRELPFADTREAFAKRQAEIKAEEERTKAELTRKEILQVQQKKLAKKPANSTGGGIGTHSSSKLPNASPAVNLTVKTTESVTVIASSKSAYNCVGYLRSIGVAIPMGYGAAKNLPVKTKDPKVGAVMVSYDSSLGHVSLVTAIEGNNIIVQDGNYRRGKVTRRVVPINSGKIKGFF